MGAAGDKRLARVYAMLWIPRQFLRQDAPQLPGEALALLLVQVHQHLVQAVEDHQGAVAAHFLENP